MIYLDNAATTPVHDEVLAAAVPFFRGDFANPSSSHEPGQRAKRALAHAREQIAQILGVRPREIIFTSGGTESNNTALSAVALGRRERSGADEIIVSSIEHASVRESAESLRRYHGFTVHTIGTDSDGLIELDQLSEKLSPNTAIVSIGYANNEIGTVQDLESIAALSKAAGAPLHSDAVQAAGWLPLRRDGLGYDLLSLSGHKIGALKGTGVLVAPSRLAWAPLMNGGGQENERRSGTENVAGAVALAKALELAESGREDYLETVAAFEKEFIELALATSPGLQLTGHPDQRRKGLVSFIHPGLNGETVLLELERRGIICASGSACSAGSTEPSKVLLALGIEPDAARTSTRFSFPRYAPKEFYRSENAAALASGLAQSILAAQS